MMVRPCILLALLAACRPTLRVLPTDWPSFGRDDDNSRTNPVEAQLDATSIKNARALWRMDTAASTSTPVIAEGRMYVGSWDGSLLVLEPASGKLVARVQVSDKVLTASAAVGDFGVYIGDGAGVLHSVARDTLKLQWSKPVDSHPDAFVFSSPAIVDDIVVIGSASTEVVSAPMDFTFRGSVVGFDAVSGRERWRAYLTQNDATSGAGVSVWSSAAVDKKRRRVFIGTGQTYEQPASPYADGLVALDSDTGAIVWHRQFTTGDVYTFFQPPPTGPDADVGAAPNLFSVGARDVVGVGDKAGIYSVLDRDTGETVWAQMLTQGSHLGGVMLASAVANGRIFVVSNAFKDPTALPSPGDHAVAFALDTGDGHVVWSTQIDSPCFGAVSTAAGVVYFGSNGLGPNGGSIYALSADSGAILWQQALGVPVASGPMVWQGILLVPFGMSFFQYSAEVRGGVAAFAP